MARRWPRRQSGRPTATDEHALVEDTTGRPRISAGRVAKDAMQSATFRSLHYLIARLLNNQARNRAMQYSSNRAFRWSWPISRILSLCDDLSARPTRRVRGQHHPLPIWPCFRRGFHGRPVARTAGGPLPHHFTLAEGEVLGAEC